MAKQKKLTKQKKHNLQWIKETLELPENHNWNAKPGYKIFVAGRGAVRFNVPQDWFFEPDEKSFRFLDNEPPNDNSRLEVSFNQFPQADLSQVPLIELKNLLGKVVEGDKRDAIATGEIVILKRQTARIVWTEIKFIDRQEEPREAFSRICIGLGSNIQCLITFDYWADEAEQMTPVWDEVLQSLVLGLYIRDPKTGFAFPD